MALVYLMDHLKDLQPESVDWSKSYMIGMASCWSWLPSDGCYINHMSGSLKTVAQCFAYLTGLVGHLTTASE